MAVLNDALLAIFRRVIASCLGDDAWPIIADYVRNGEDVADSEITLVVTPLVIYLLSQVNSVIEGNTEQAYAKYLGDQLEADTI